MAFIHLLVFIGNTWGLKNSEILFEQTVLKSGCGPSEILRSVIDIDVT